MRINSSVGFALVMSAFLLTSPRAQAETFKTGEGSAVSSMPVSGLLAHPQEDMLFGGVAAVQDGDLDDVRGMSGTTTFTAEALGVAILTGVAANNTADNAFTGSNNITGNAFGDANGVSFVVQNTGNNSVINAAMVINLSLSQ